MDSRQQKGVVLKGARQAKGVSLEAVHEATKIPMDVLRAIEEGYTVRTLSPFYIRGFLKMYAKYLGVDINQVVEDYHPEKLPKIISTASPAVPLSLKSEPLFSPQRIILIKKILVLVLIGVVVIFAFGKIAKFFKNRPHRQPVKKAVVTKNTPRETASDNKKEALFSKAKLVVKKEEAKADSPLSSESVVMIKEPPQPAPETAQTVVAQPVKSKNINLSVRAKKDSWLQVKVDDQVVFQSTLKKGAVETWLADHSVEIAGKNVSELEFELNGKTIGSLGRADRNARKIVVNKSGLSVKQ